MRFKRPKENEQRVNKGFLYMPRVSIDYLGNRETRWLEYAYWHEYYFVSWSGLSYWTTTKFLTKNQYEVYIKKEVYKDLSITELIKAFKKENGYDTNR